jgi:hypothetical protein
MRKQLMISAAAALLMAAANSAPAAGATPLGTRPTMGAQTTLGTSIRGSQTLQQTAPSGIHPAPGSLGSR